MKTKDGLWSLYRCEPAKVILDQLADKIDTIGLGRIRDADAFFGGKWARCSLSGDQALRVILPHHTGERTDGDSLVPMEGATVAQTLQKFESIREDYKREYPGCWAKISGKKDLTPIFLSWGPMNTKEYRHIKTTKDHLVHLDGLHRLLSWGLRGRFLDASIVIDALVAG